MNTIQAGLQSHAVLTLGQGRRSRWTVKNDPAVDMKTPPKVQVDTMPAGATLPMRQSCSSSSLLT